MAMITLHILTPAGTSSPQSLLENNNLVLTDLVADLRNFPPAVYRFEDEGVVSDVTAQIFTPPDYWTTIKTWLVNFTQQTGLQDILQVRGYGFWWTLNSQKFVPGVSEVGDAFAWIDCLQAIARHAPVKRVKLYGSHKAIIHLLGQILPQAEMETISDAPIQVSARSKSARQPALLLARLLWGLVYLGYSLFFRPDICIFTGTGLLRESGSHNKLQDVIFGEIINRLQSKKFRLTVVEKYGWGGSWRGLFARGWFFPNDIVFVLSNPVLHKWGLTKKWTQQWHSIRPQLTPFVTYQNCDLSPFIIPLLKKEFTNQAPGFEAMSNLWRTIFKLWQPRAIYLNNSYGRSAAPAIVAAKSLNILTVEQQHGLIGKNHFCYFVPQTLKAKTKFIQADTIITWGQHTTQQLLEAGAYSPKQVLTYGFPRIDAMLQNLPSKHQTLAQLNFPSEARVILYTSNEFAKVFIDDMLNSIKQTPSEALFWIIKLHPREETRLIWEQGISRYQLNNVVVIRREFDFYALLAACDVHLSFASTTLIESAILGKINLGLDSPFVIDPGGFKEAQAFLPVLPSQLGETVQSILNNQAQQKHLAKVQKQFAQSWCLHDGKTVARIVDYLEKL